VKETGSDDSALRQQEQMALKAIEDNGRVAVQLELLGEKENQLAMFIPDGPACRRQRRLR
jgi:hypothetical protein